MKKPILLTLLFIASVFCKAQEHTIENITKMTVRSRGYILDNGNAIAGYYAFYKNDKVDKKNAAYTLELMDNNLNSVKNINVIRPKNSYLLETVFNGEVFLFYFIED